MSAATVHTDEMRGVMSLLYFQSDELPYYFNPDPTTSPPHLPHSRASYAAPGTRSLRGWYPLYFVCACTQDEQYMFAFRSEANYAAICRPLHGRARSCIEILDAMRARRDVFSDFVRPAVWAITKSTRVAESSIRTYGVETSLVPLDAMGEVRSARSGTVKLMLNAENQAMRFNWKAKLEHASEMAEKKEQRDAFQAIEQKFACPKVTQEAHDRMLASATYREFTDNSVRQPNALKKRRFLLEFGIRRLKARLSKYQVVGNVLMHLVYVCFFAGWMTNANMFSDDTYWMGTGLRNCVNRGETIDPSDDVRVGLFNISSPPQFWHWARASLVSGCLGANSNSFWATSNSQIGAVRIRQQRRPMDSCPTELVGFDGCFKNCGIYYLEPCSQANFGPSSGLTAAQYGDMDASRVEGRYHWSEGSMPFSIRGKMQWYGADGYMVNLPPNDAGKVGRILDQLEDDHWFDSATVMIAIEVVWYNANTGMFGSSRMLVEWGADGFASARYVFRPLQITGVRWTYWVCGALTIVELTRTAHRLVLSFCCLKPPWNELTKWEGMHIGSMCTSIVVLVLYFITQELSPVGGALLAQANTAKLDVNSPEYPASLESYFELQHTYVEGGRRGGGACAAVSYPTHRRVSSPPSPSPSPSPPRTRVVAGDNFQALLLLFFKFLRNQPSAMFGVRMLKKAGAQLVAYITVSAVLFIGFAFAAHLVYGPYIYAFSNVLLSAFTLVEISQGIMPEEVRAFDQAGSFIDWILAGVPQTLMICFVFIFWALLTMTLRAIIIDAYAGVLTEIERKAKVVHQHVWWSEDGIGRLHGYIKEMMPHNNFGSILTLLQSRTTQARVYLSHPELVEAIRGACVLMWPLTYVDAICERLNLVALRDALHRQFIADPVVIATHLMSMQSVDVYRVPEVLALLEDALLPKADEGEPTLRAAVRIERAALRSMGVDLDPTGRAPSTMLVEATPQFKVWRAKFAADIERCLDSNASQPGTRASNGAEWDIIAHVDVSRIKIEGLGPVGESAIVSFAVVMRRDADRADVESRLQQSVESVDSCLYDDEVSETTRQLTRAIRFEPGMYDFQVNTGNGLDEITRGLDWCNDTVKGVVVHSMLFAVTKRVLAGRKELREQMTAVKDRQKVVMQRLRDVQHQQRKARWYLEGGTHNFLATPDAATIDGIEGDQDPETVKKIFAAYGAAAKAAAATLSETRIDVASGAADGGGQGSSAVGGVGGDGKKGAAARKKMVGVDDDESDDDDDDSDDVVGAGLGEEDADMHRQVPWHATNIDDRFLHTEWPKIRKKLDIESKWPRAKTELAKALHPSSGSNSAQGGGGGKSGGAAASSAADANGGRVSEVVGDADDEEEDEEHLFDHTYWTRWHPERLVGKTIFVKFKNVRGDVSEQEAVVNSYMREKRRHRLQYSIGRSGMKKIKEYDMSTTSFRVKSARKSGGGAFLKK